ncbi:MAG: gamma-glutamylcyclotransferase [Deltaproteobacteria bacterium]|nr:gamma-glutamylcyclotransferase [Deltaproteobacteria bacterium]MBW2121140.1 gamma-glutamylcyclotransferase [Deltaproteobacteria bacterium]
MIEYFSYGSNLNQESLDVFCDKTKKPRIPLHERNPRRARLRNYALDFNYYSPLMGGGAANLEPSPGEEVEGVVFTMTEQDMATLDQRERAPEYFKRILVSVVLEDGTTLHDVVAYVACEDKKSPFTPPTRDYKAVIVAGAESYALSPEWIRKLKDLPEQDPTFKK